jgi:acetylornithine deacetylase/succinyl-diaminopimelate desuccinylase-like protein
MSDLSAMIESHIDRAYLTQTLTTFLQTPSDAPLGQNFIDPRDPLVAHCVRNVIQPRLEALGYTDLLNDEDNNLVCVGGADQEPTLLMMAYSSSHHGNLMPEPYSGKIESGSAYGVDETCAFGRGAGKSGAMAALFAALKLIKDRGIRLRGRLVLAINTEGYSSHRGSTTIFRGLAKAGLRPQAAVLCNGTGLRACIGQRGRVDVFVDVIGRETHSSQPSTGLSAIEGAYRVLTLLKEMRFPKKHARLGPEQLTPYKLVFEPIAPHTLPEVARFRLDRRFVPEGTTPEEAVAEVRSALADLAPYQVKVSQGPFMLPWENAPTSPIVLALGTAMRECTGRELETFYARYTGDTGYVSGQGVASVDFGPTAYSEEDRPTATEFVSLSSVDAAAQVYAHVIMSFLGTA